MPEVKIMRSPKRQMRGIDPDAVWVDKYGRTAEITGSDGVKRPLNKDNWNEILSRMNPLAHRAEYNHLLKKLEGMGYRHVDDIRLRRGQDHIDPRPSEVTPIPNYQYRYDSREPAKKVPLHDMYSTAPDKPANA